MFIIVMFLIILVVTAIISTVRRDMEIDRQIRAWHQRQAPIVEREPAYVEDPTLTAAIAAYKATLKYG
jgi:hypothetical protein